MTTMERMTKEFNEGKVRNKKELVVSTFTESLNYEKKQVGLILALMVAEMPQLFERKPCRSVSRLEVV